MAEPGDQHAGGHDPVIFDHLGDTCWRLKQADKAVAQWTRALEEQKEKVQRGEATPDREFTSALEAKVAAVRAGRAPEVADYGEKAASTTQPAAN